MSSDADTRCHRCGRAGEIMVPDDADGWVWWCHGCWRDLAPPTRAEDET